MDFPPLEVMRIRDCILTFKQLEGEQIHKSWARFKGLIAQGPNHGIPDMVLLDRFYRSPYPGNKQLLDQLIPGGIAHIPYMMVAQLLDHMAEAEREIEKDVMLATLKTQVDGLAKSVMKIESQCKKKDKCAPLGERKSYRDKEVERIEEMLSTILLKLSE